MSKWQEKRLGEVVNYITRGITPKYTANGIKVINQKCIRDYKINLDFCKETLDTTNIGKKYVQYGDILINSTGTGTLGRVACSKIQNMPITFDSHVTLCRVGKEYNNFFIGYYLHSIEKELENFGRGSTNQTELNINDIKKIKINIPDLVTQEKMADILSTYDDLIENNNRRIDILEQMAQEIYKEWFVRFRFPGHEKVKFVNGIPEGWEVKKIKDIVDRKPFGTLYKESQVQEDGKVIVIDQSKKDYIGFHNNEPSHNADIEKPMILFGDHSCKYKIMIRPFSLAENVIPFTSNDENLLTTYYLFYSINGIIQTTEYKRHWTDLTNKKIIISNINLQTKFEEKIKEFLLEIEQLSIINRNLIKQRDLLLPRLMSGKLEV